MATRTPARPGRRLLKHDRAIAEDPGVRLVAGVDEAGRGALAGPLVAAAVVLEPAAIVGPDAAPLGRLDDSKKLAEPIRERLYATVHQLATAIAVTIVDPATIDRDGLHASNLAAMRRCIDALRTRPDVVLVDGFDVAHPTLDCRRIVKGDATSASVAAAAIIAKVTRDRLLRRLDTTLDGRWALADHVGYATPLHAERIQAHGITRLHRRSYAARAYDGAPDATPPALDLP